MKVNLGYFINSKKCDDDKNYIINYFSLSVLFSGKS